MGFLSIDSFCSMKWVFCDCSQQFLRFPNVPPGSEKVGDPCFRLFHSILILVSPELGCKIHVWSHDGYDSVVFTASLIPPMLTVTADGYHLLVELERLGPAFEFWIYYWKKGQGHKVRFGLISGLRMQEQKRRKFSCITWTRSNALMRNLWPSICYWTSTSPGQHRP